MSFIVSYRVREAQSLDISNSPKLNTKYISMPHPRAPTEINYAYGNQFQGIRENTRACSEDGGAEPDSSGTVYNRMLQAALKKSTYKDFVGFKNTLGSHRLMQTPLPCWPLSILVLCSPSFPALNTPFKARSSNSMFKA
jgi:hypothetical protein